MKWRTVSPWCVESDASYRITKAGPEDCERYACWRGSPTKDKKRTAWECFTVCDCPRQAQQLCNNDHEERNHGNAR